MCAVGIVTRVYLFFTGNMRNNDHITGSDKISFNSNNNETQSTSKWGPWKKKSKAGKGPWWIVTDSLMKYQMMNGNK